MTDALPKTTLAKSMFSGAMLGLTTGFFGAFFSWVLWVLNDYLLGLPSDSPTYILTAGICFGLGLGWIGKRHHALATWAILVITALIPIIYYGAYFSALIVGSGASFIELIFAGLLGGGVGAGLVAILCIIFLTVPRKAGFMMTITFVGTVAGAVVVPLYVSVLEGHLILYLMHMIWHASVFAALYGMLSTGWENGPAHSQIG